MRLSRTHSEHKAKDVVASIIDVGGFLVIFFVFDDRLLYVVVFVFVVVECWMLQVNE